MKTLAHVESGAPVRRVGDRVEVHRGTARPGKPYVLGRDDLVLLIGQQSARLRCRRRVHSLPPDLVFVVDIGDVVVLELTAPAPSRALYLEPGILSELMPFLPDVAAAAAAGRRVVRVSVGAGLCERADRMSSEDQLAPLIQQAEASGKCQIQVATAEGVGHAVVWRVRDHLRDDYASNETLEQISSDIGMCSSALVRAFTRELGIPPHMYRTHLRVLHARDLIAAGNALSDVSLQVGFVDQSHLTRHFKRLLGFTPARYASIRSIPSKPRRGASGDRA